MNRFLLSISLIYTYSGLFGQVTKPDTTVILKHIQVGDSLLRHRDYETANIEYRLAAQKINNLSLYYKANPSEDLQVFLLNDSAIAEKIKFSDSLVSIFVTDTMRYQKCLDRARKHTENEDFKLAVYEYRTALYYLPNDSIVKKEIDALANIIRTDTLRITQVFHVQSLYSYSGNPVNLDNVHDTLFTLFDSTYFEGTIIQQTPPGLNTFETGDSLTILTLDYKSGILQKQSYYTCKLKPGLVIDHLSLDSFDKLPPSSKNKNQHWNCILANSIVRDEPNDQVIYTTYYESGELQTMIIESRLAPKLNPTRSIKFSESGDTLLIIVETYDSLTITQFLEMNYKTYRLEVQYLKPTNTITDIEADRLICLGYNKKILTEEKFLKKLRYEKLDVFDIYLLQLTEDDTNLYIVVYYSGSNFNPNSNQDIFNLRAQVAKKLKIKSSTPSPQS
jgi:hypothetical protein